MTTNATNSTPAGFEIRRIESRDFAGVTTALSGLTTVGDLSQSQFDDILAYWDTQLLPGRTDGARSYNTSVIIESATGRVAAVGTVFVEKKLIHAGGLVGHIEDIAVNPDFRGKQLGKVLINHLSALGASLGCYKVILDCDEKNVGFYEKCGYSRAGVEMQVRM
ncbi:glucosamine 6-phosphate N-acetyltransferase [Maudiozyma humilis]|uniref:Glucosamine 6-phosphate N-acetyltransferase n=1 Tax=Maudiozyma humilis TaxID=51915 RepID=A0AAV5S1G7_MAUHU|nr:hypothetical protein DAKH74_043200 [Kazachstania humilis]GMM58234.1 glucosamine 6-phosphate N-acetyltransferase [Kazachstania humilis]